YDAVRLVAQGLEQAPESSVGHLLSAYLHAAARETAQARVEFDRVLALDPYHPRALLGLARIGIEEQDLEGAKALLDRALQFYSGFPEAKALQDMVLSWATQPKPEPEPEPASTVTHDDSEMTSSARDVVMASTDGALVSANVHGERGRAVAQHLTQVSRMASATLGRAGLGALRRGMIGNESDMTFLASDGAGSLCVTLAGPRKDRSGLGQ